MADIATQLRGAEACRPALEWIQAEGYSELREVWDNCERGDWLLWFVHILGVNPQLVMQTAIECARVVADTPRGRRRSDLAFELARAEAVQQPDASHVKRARRMVELASHRHLLAAPDMGALKSMVDIVRQRIPWPLVEAQVEIRGGAVVRKIDE